MLFGPHVTRVLSFLASALPWNHGCEVLNSNQSTNVQALKEQVSSLQSQIKEQEVKVKAAAPDKKELDGLQKKVDTYRKGWYC